MTRRFASGSAIPWSAARNRWDASTWSSSSPKPRNRSITSRDSAGISLAGTTGAESKYTVEGANVNNPSFGTVGASIVQEFVETVEVQESGYDAEYGGAAGGQVSARRVSGTNTLRGVARFESRQVQGKIVLLP